MLMGALCRALRNSSSKGELKDTYVEVDLRHRTKNSDNNRSQRKGVEADVFC